MKELSSMLPSRFRNKFIKNMPENEAEELLYKYSRFFDVPVTEETAFSLVRITEGNPFYISAVIRSDHPGKDLTTIDGLTDTLEFETLDDQGLINKSLLGKYNWLKGYHAVNSHDYSIIGEVKNREVKKFSLDDIKDFELKFAEIKKLENLERVVGFIFSRAGFTAEAEAYCKEKGIACSEDERWLESGNLKPPLV